MAARARAWGIATARKVVRHRFPRVRQLPPSELAAWLNDPRRPGPVLLDVRTAAEYTVSHLPGARWVSPRAKAAEVIAGLHPDHPVVVYCSLGYRSSALADRLMTAGLRGVFNLEGAIFVWANEGRALERDGQRVTAVHPYHWLASWLLEAPRRGPTRP
ncbi:MAG: rhodanese-like domain-containing protein [Limisphaerales bacterium]